MVRPRHIISNPNAGNLPSARKPQLTSKYPPAQPVTTIPMTTDTLADPKVLPTTVGMVEKKPPLAIPFTITKTIKGPSDVEIGQMISILRALSSSEINNVFSGPTKSLHRPHNNLPSAEEKLNAATTPAPVPDDMPREAVNSGRKNGGTKRGNVAMAPIAKRSTKRMSRNRRLNHTSAPNQGC